MHGMASESWELASPNSPSHLLESEHDAPPREGLPLVGTQASLPSQPSSMGQLLAAYQIPADLHPAFQDYHPAEFGLVATSLEDLDSFLAELVYPTATARVADQGQNQAFVAPLSCYDGPHAAAAAAECTAAGGATRFLVG